MRKYDLCSKKVENKRNKDLYMIDSKNWDEKSLKYILKKEALYKINI